MYERPDISWMDSRNCVGVPVSVFFPEVVPGRKGKDYDPIGDPRSLDDAQRVIASTYCSSCPVADDCLDYAVMTGQKAGVWGNTTEAERKPLLREAKTMWRSAAKYAPY